MRIEHVAIYVSDLERAKSFYCEYFGGCANEAYHNRTTDFHSYFLTFTDGCRLELMHHPEIALDKKDLRRSGFVHMAFSVGSKEAVDSLTRRLQSDGFTVVSGPRTTGDGYYESCILDYEGNQIEITV